MTEARAIEQWLAHRPPFRFVDELLEAEEERGLFALYLAQDDPRLTNDRLEPLLLVEALAQSMAAFDGYLRAGVKATGMLAEVKASFFGAARGGDTVMLEVTRTRELADLARFSCRAMVGEELLVEAVILVKRTSSPA